MRIPNYTVFEYVRKDSNGGGFLTTVHNSLEPVFVAEGEDVEVIVVEVTLSGQKARLINGYGKQEYDKEEERTRFYSFLDLQIKSANIF